MNSQTASLDLELKFEVGEGDRESLGRNSLRFVQCVCDEMIGTSKGESLSLYILELVGTIS